MCKSIKFIYRSNLLLFLLITGCASSVDQPSQSLITLPSPRENINKRIIDKKVSQLSLLPNKERVLTTVSLGKEDPFTEVSDADHQFKNSVILKGIISDGIKDYAIISYYGNTGAIKEGEIGGKTTQLIPDGLKVEKISVKQRSVILSRNQKSFEIGFPK